MYIVVMRDAEGITGLTHIKKNDVGSIVRAIKHLSPYPDTDIKRHTKRFEGFFFYQEYPINFTVTEVEIVYGIDCN